MTKDNKADIKNLDELINSSENAIQEKTELGEVMESLDRDELDTITNMSSIDTNSFLTGSQITGLMKFDQLQGKMLFSPSCSISRQLKRLSISKMGLGRQNKVDCVVAERGRSNTDTSGFFNMFKRQE